MEVPGNGLLSTYNSDCLDVFLIADILLIACYFMDIRSM